MDEVYKFLKENPIFYVATMDGDQPRVRPFGVVALFEGKLYLCTMGKDGTSWLRVAAEVVLDPRVEARRHMLEENPTLRRLYSEDDGVGEVLWLKNATATFYSFEGEPRVVKF